MTSILVGKIGFDIKIKDVQMGVNDFKVAHFVKIQGEESLVGVYVVLMFTNFVWKVIVIVVEVLGGKKKTGFCF